MFAVRLLGFGLVLYGVYVMAQKATLTVKNQSWDSAQPVDAAVDVLARTVWGEARGEGATGMQAVANVVINRAARPGWWGSDVRSVCQAPYQFSCWNATDPNLIRLLNVDSTDPQFAQALDIAAAAVAGQLPDITGGATNYHTINSNPSWAGQMTETAQIGNHVFYA